MTIPRDSTGSLGSLPLNYLDPVLYRALFSKGNIYVIRRAYPLLVAVFTTLLQLSGCAFFQEPAPSPPPYVTQGCATGDILQDLRQTDASLHSIDATARVQIEINSQKQPSVACSIKWVKDNQSDCLRITGRGPFGITLFDALLKDNRFLLYLPSHRTIYTADLTSQYQTMQLSQKAVEARIIVDGWSALSAITTNQIACAAVLPSRNIPEDSVCFSSYTGQIPIVSMFSSHNRAPLTVVTHSYTVHFRGTVPRSFNTPPCLNYPGTVLLILKDWNVRLRADLKEITFNTLTPTDASFDRHTFDNIPSMPLNMLFKRGHGH